MNIFKSHREIFKYNLVTKGNQVYPNYDVTNKEIYFKFYLSTEMEICIIGEVDNNYIVWGSLTKLNDIDINSKIFDYIANNDFNIFSQEHKVFGNEWFMKSRNWYKAIIKKATIPDMCWETPFGHYYGNDRENHGNYFSRDIQTFFEEQLDKCQIRICKGAYLDILNNYVDILTKDSDYRYYYKMKPLISILECEAYMRLCPNVDIRELYLRCMEECSKLYNRYMTAVR